jgi:hypothetical protein
VQPISDAFLINISEISATLVGLFVVGVFFYAESGFRQLHGQVRIQNIFLQCITITTTTHACNDLTFTIHCFAAINLREFITEIPDFPKSGILFRDISPLLKLKFHETIDAMPCYCLLLGSLSVFCFKNDEQQNFDF